VPESLVLPLGERLDDQRCGLVGLGLLGRNPDQGRTRQVGARQIGFEQLMVGVAQVGVALQHGLDPGPLQGEGQPELFCPAQAQGVLQRPATARAVTG